MGPLPVPGASFSAELPLAWLRQLTQTPLEASRYLAVLAEFEQQAEKQQDVDESLHAKLDLALLWLARSQHVNPASPRQVQIGLSHIAWQMPVAMPVGETGVLAVCFSDVFPLQLQLPARITACRAEAGEFFIQAELIWRNEDLQGWYERTVFRYHRRQIQNQRGDAL